ncbi:PH domain-containing protein [Microterricola viridarii]|nr:PH domain-containing protein [Microterricola viridarii]
MTNHGGAAQPAAGGMPPSGRAAQSAAPAEHVIARLRRHGRMLFWPTILLLAVAGAAGYLGGRMPEEWQNIAVLVVAALLVLIGFVVPLLAWLSRRYTITTRRVIVRHGFFVRVRQELMHSRGYDVSVRRSWLQSAFRTGDILINTGQEQPIVLRDVPNASLVQRTLHELMEANQGANAARRPGGQPAGDDHTVAWGER